MKTKMYEVSFKDVETMALRKNDVIVIDSDNIMMLDVLRDLIKLYPVILNNLYMFKSRYRNEFDTGLVYTANLKPINDVREIDNDHNIIMVLSNNSSFSACLTAGIDTTNIFAAAEKRNDLSNIAVLEFINGIFEIPEPNNFPMRIRHSVNNRNALIDAMYNGCHNIISFDELAKMFQEAQGCNLSDLSEGQQHKLNIIRSYMIRYINGD